MSFEYISKSGVYISLFVITLKNISPLPSPHFLQDKDHFFKHFSLAFSL